MTAEIRNDVILATEQGSARGRLPVLHRPGAHHRLDRRPRRTRPRPGGVFFLDMGDVSAHRLQLTRWLTQRERHGIARLGRNADARTHTADGHPAVPSDNFITSQHI